MRLIIVDDDGYGEATRLHEHAMAAGLMTSAISTGALARATQNAVASGDPWAVVVVGASAGAALDAAAEHGGISGLVSLSGLFTDDHLELIGEWSELPVLAVARPGDRPALKSAVDIYLAGAHARSELLVDAEPAMESVVAWLVDRMKERVDVESVVFISEDGWEIHGTMRVPPQSVPVPGVVFLHTGRSDRAAYSRLERLVSERGLAVLNIDWRGRGESINLGTYFDLDDATKFAAWRDALAAFDHLANDARIDADRLSGVGCVHGAEYAVRAAWRDRRVKALAILTGYRPQEPEETELLISGDVEVMYVNAKEHTITGQSMRDLCQRAPRGTAQLIEYPGSALGYQLFEIDDQLEPRIADWLAEALT